VARFQQLCTTGLAIAFCALTAAPVFGAPVPNEDRLALTAVERGDFQKAAELWQGLANRGDAIAQYNLAQLYLHGKGVSRDENVGRYWLSMAARHGLAPAYAAVSPGAIKPAEAPQVNTSVELDPKDWVHAQDPRYYTLQLASSTNERLIQKYFRENQLAGQAGYYRSRRSGEDWYALVYGAYPTVNDAKEAIKQLPEDLRKWSPWVRNIRSIQKIMLD
jgi:septal ring-binding cell division protein DamX